MSNKYLPIKIFEKRKDYDDRSTEGGGDNREPGFVLHGDELQAHAQVLASDLQEVRSQFREALSQKRTLLVIVATSLNDSAIAKTHRKRVVNILESDGNGNVVGVYGDRQILSVLPDEAVLDRHAGTSFSTPAVTRIVSDLAYMMQEEFDPLLLRALTIHYAKYPEGIQMKMTEKVNQMGFGVPIKAQDILYN